MERYKKYLMSERDVGKDEKLAIGFIADAARQIKKKDFMKAIKTLETAEEIVRSIAVQYGDVTYK